MRRLAALAALGVLGIGAAAGCSKTPESAGQNEIQATGAAASTPSGPGSSAPTTTKATTGSTGTTPRGSTVTRPPVSTPTTPAVPSIPDIPSIPGGGNLQNCLDLANAYSQIFLPLSTGNPTDADIAKATAAIDGIKSKVPSNIQADLDTLETGIKNANGLTGLAQFFSSDEFTKANNEVTTYLTAQCSKGG